MERLNKSLNIGLASFIFILMGIHSVIVDTKQQLTAIVIVIVGTRQ